MKYVKSVGLAVMAVATLMAFVGAGTASATVLTSPKGTVYHGEVITNTEAFQETITGGFKNIECVGGKMDSEPIGGGSTSTVHGPVSRLTFEQCNCEVVVIARGSLEIHSIAGTSNGTLTSTGMKVTVNCSTIFGNVHCIYFTSAADLGTVTGSSTTGGAARVDITAELSNESTNFLCAEEAIWHAAYSVTVPFFLDVS